ncbi:MAG: MerR family transcriptional regulator [Betaproteobacteria bacterium]|nr:MerR family transcriptional regulator [Betaproteobacteria bacterium]
MTARSFTLDELCTLTDLPRRTVRYYVQIGLVPRPAGETRAARYGEGHLAALLRIKQLSANGVSLERIREVLDGADAPVAARPRQPGQVEVRSHVFLAPGVELVIAPAEAGLSPEQARALIRELARAAAKVLGQDPQP